MARAGGISAATRAARDWLTAFGFDCILIETVGVGQDQIAVRDLVDTLVLLVTPNTGDEVQWEKAGVIEVADLVVVNKSDLPGADRVRHQLVSALSLGPNARRVEVLNITASTGRRSRQVVASHRRAPAGRHRPLTGERIPLSAEYRQIVWDAELEDDCRQIVQTGNSRGSRPGCTIGRPWHWCPKRCQAARWSAHVVRV